MTFALAAWVALAAPLAHCEGARLQVEGVDVEQVAELAAGVPLNFSVYATAHALATLRIEGGWRVLQLREVEPGVYEGTYVIDARDAIVASSRVTATLQRGGELAEADLDEPLLLAENALPWADAGATPSPQSEPLPQSAPVPRSTPQPQSAPVPQWAPVPQSTPVPQSGPGPAWSPAPQPSPVPARADPLLARAAEPAACADCALVESVRAVESAPTGGAIGAVAGAIAGAVLGQELGQAHTQRMLRLLGAVGGALAGRQIERQATQRLHWEVVLRTSDGRTQTRRYDSAPPFAPGETIRLGTAPGAPSPF